MAKAVSRAQLEGLSEALDFEESHAQRVSALCEQLFAETRHVHGLTKTSRPLLQVVATLHTHNGANGEHAPAAARRRPALADAFPRLTGSQYRVIQEALEAVSASNGAVRGGATDFGPPVCQPGDRQGAPLALRIAALVRLADGLDASRIQGTYLVGVVDDGEGIDLLVAGPSAEADAPAALERAGLWNALMPRRIRAVRVHDGPPPWPGLILPDHSVAETCRRVLLQQIETFMGRTYGLCYDEDIEYVHELRVALRRSRSALRVFDEALNGARDAFQAEVRWFAGELGAVRDLDVFLGFLARHRDGTPRAHRPFLRRLLHAMRARRRRHYRKLLDAFAAERYQHFIERFYPMLRAPVGGAGSLFPPGEACEEPIAEAAPRLVWRQLKKVLRYDRRLDRLTPENQHELRIECKRLRYTTEFLADIYPGRLIGVTEPATALQDELGDVHDADVYRDRVLTYCERRRGGADAAERDAVEALLGCLREQRARHLRRASRAWRAFTRTSHVERLKEVIGCPRNG